MKPINPTRWKCDHCTRTCSVKRRAAKHELHCWRNSGREPWPGELTSITWTGKVRDWGPDSSLPGGMNWYEWEPVALPAWWPGEGMIWTGEEWQDVPHYESRQIGGAHGCAGGAGPEDCWPEVWTDFGGRIGLDMVKPARYRLEKLSTARRPLESKSLVPGFRLSPAARQELAPP